MVSDSLFSTPVLTLEISLRHPDSGGTLPERLTLTEQGDGGEPLRLTYRPPPPADTEVTVTIDTPTEDTAYRVDAFDDAGSIMDVVSFVIVQDDR